MTENYTYDANGYLAAIKIGGQRVWERDSYTGTQRRWALGTQPLYVTRKYSDKGLLTEQEIIRQAGLLHKMTYSFDGATGNLTQRTGMNGTETFKYDQFDRLNTGTSYALNGNIASKTGIGKYTYDANKKHAVVQVQNTGNLIQGAASLTYTAFNKVATVVQGANTLTITYGPDRQRAKTVLVNGSNTTTTLYADNYEQRTTNGVTKSYHYVASPDGLAAVYVKSGNTATAYYIETDHLGSIVRAYDYLGNIKFSAAYDAWGNQNVFINAIGLTRGYTGHEHWNQFGLIDMNGRFYDPLLGRFLSPDPYVQAPDNPQSYNRYAYCLNNPLKYTDPSGEFFWIPFAIGAAFGAYTGYKIADANGYNLGDWQTYGYIVGGAFIGGMSGAAGAEIAAGGGVMANTMGIMVASHINSTGMKCLSGGRTDYTLSFGAVSYNFTQGEWGYLGKPGNSKIQNVGYGFGALANLSDVVALFGGGTNADLIVEKKDAISHSAFVNESEGINISVGPYRELGEGIDMEALKSGTGTFKELSRTMKGKIWENHATDGHGWKLPINNVNKNILTKLSNSLQTKMDNQTLMWNLLGKSCVGYTSKALWSVGVPNLGGIHPYWLQLQMMTRQLGIYSSPYLYQIHQY